MSRSNSNTEDQPKHQVDDTLRQKVLVLGWRKAGKTSCIKTVFQQVPAVEVPHFGVTQKIEQIDYNSIVPLQIWDTPSNFEIDQLEVPLSTFSTIVYVLDMQQDDSYHDSIRKFVHIMVRAYLANPEIRFHMFIHKAEMLSEDYRGENYAEIQRTTAEEIEDFRYGDLRAYAPSNLDLDDPQTIGMIINQLIPEVVYSMTSAHDVSLRAAWSKVIQGSMEMLSAVEALLLDFSTSLYKAISQRPSADEEDEDDDDEEKGPDGEEDEEDEEEDDDEPKGWWDDEDPDAPWMTQSTRLLPSTTLAMWQFTPIKKIPRVGSVAADRDMASTERYN
ncbi:hypothetical protein I307_03702 [Cryptococcus deuterogattii 99/473]|uniref:GTP-binding protein n=1 Tax=Cryptococcus deuterogattii Ram5 TaxID=1296110 RepID=A0A0D0U4U7_9TREE|nr:hypothetical protein I309_00729 [Cryptococcus deuterogattii LA55]KIR36747.1 hypothetical protein I352_00058 [Cryptococcus deuterogattii MMRL2647]KIR43218.1 hypothetical protein I313_00059 [Cryptococcus deuterogattii Ram5]KIR69742.1 hypothetical protein I310_06466 [Cryptococcus deuterogattii CA1014]KIR92522.1 hypothetical protein I304_03927 [Cryptococcus deuterogattii CBS 10090]KIS01688.1 hypothetical protein L804_01567 [Cryptococcus deuterogattii 2001/935-1]KIY56964.1 hypothetical protein 